MSKKLLLVDDENRILQLEKVLFTKNGYDVVTAADGDGALKAALAERPDLVVLDIEMPGKDGYATLMEMRGHEALKKTPVIIMSGLTDDVYHGISGSLGTVAHINKPFAPDVLLAKVREIIGE